MHPRDPRVLILAFAALLSGCGPDYSPNTYSAVAVQQANKVEQGVIVGVRAVGVSAPGTVGAVTGAAAGGIVGSQTPGNVGSAFGALGGALVGGLVGTTVEHTTSDTTAFEYIVRKPNGDLLSVTQQDEAPLALGQKVLLIDGKQARIVPDYTVPAATAGTAGTKTPPSASITSTVPPTAHVEATPLAPPPGNSVASPGASVSPGGVVTSVDPPLATPVPPPPLTPGAPTALSPP